MDFEELITKLKDSKTSADVNRLINLLENAHYAKIDEIKSTIKEQIMIEENNFIEGERGKYVCIKDVMDAIDSAN